MSNDNHRDGRERASGDRQSNAGWDPADAFREMFTEWQRGFDQLAGSFDADSFNRSMKQMQDMQMAAWDSFRELFSENLNPGTSASQADIQRLNDAVAGLDERLARIEQLLASQAAHPQDDV